MFTALAYVHGQLLRLCLWLLKLPLKAIWGAVAGVVLLLGEEVRRWLGITVAGLLIFLAGRATLSLAPDGLKRPLVLTILVMVVIWALAVRRAIHYTAHNNLIRVRQRQWARKLSGEVVEVRERLSVGAAKAARGTPFEGMFGPNRDRREQEQAEAQAAAQQAETQCQEAEERERHLDEMTALEPNPYETQPR